jgi:hypothetical protein
MKRSPILTQFDVISATVTGPTTATSTRRWPAWSGSGGACSSA